MDLRKQPWIFILSSFLLMISPEICTSQDYHPFPETNAYWTVAEFNWDIWDYETYIYTIKGDTISNGKTYKKVYQLNDIPGSQDTLWVLHNLMRQDTLNKKIYFIRIYQNETTEKLGYDFDVEIGDTVYLPAFDYANLGDSVFMYMESGTDSIQLWNGEYRKHYLFASLDPYSDLGLSTTEGIGTIRTAFPNLFFYDPFHQSEMTCHSVNGEYLYGPSPYPDECDFSVWIKEIGESKNILCYPNPANDRINLLLPERLSQPGLLQLYNNMGVCIYHNNLEDVGNELFIDASGIPTGIYYLVLSTDTMRFAKIVIIIH